MERLSHDQLQPGSFFQGPREAEKRDPGNEIEVSYESSTHEPFRECSTGSHVKSITLSVRNQDGELFDFKGFNLEFVLEIN